MTNSLSQAAASAIRTTLAATIVLVSLAARPALAADAQVKIANFTFDPPTLTVKTGTTVTWVNADDIPHLVSEMTASSAQVPSTQETNSRRCFRLPARSSISAPSTHTWLGGHLARHRRAIEAYGMGQMVPKLS